LAQTVVDEQVGWTRFDEGDDEGPDAEPLPADTLHVVGTRAGHEPGTHTVGFDGPHEQITLRHRSRSRDGFALGAVLAAEWLNGRSGRFEFDRVIEDLIEGS
jgi:4-hydroxy-tetrahydrodipicolinate reductase